MLKILFFLFIFILANQVKANISTSAQQNYSIIKLYMKVLPVMNLQVY